MATPAKKKANDEAKVIGNKSTNNYINDPYFVKKREMALKIIQKVGLPDSLVRTKNKHS